MRSLRTRALLVRASLADVISFFLSDSLSLHAGVTHSRLARGTQHKQHLFVAATLGRPRPTCLFRDVIDSLLSHVTSQGCSTPQKLAHG